MTFKKLKIAIILQLALSTAYAQNAVPVFKPNNLLQSNMVIQQNKPFHLWGTAPAGDVIILKADWLKKEVKTIAGEKGNWTGKIKVPKANPGVFMSHTIFIIHKKDTVKSINILIGEIWLCSGQSNMEFRMAKIPNWGTGVQNYEKEVAEANYPYIRLFKPDMGVEFQPMSDCKGTWKICDPKSAGDFSAVGYYFARELFNRLQVPIGMIDAAIPATACQAFANINVLEADPILKQKFVDPYAKGLAAIKERNDKSTPISTLEYPALVYNKMIHPLINLSIKGFLWYQGESNRQDTILYPRLCSAMLKGWRKDFKQGGLPFYYVQVAPYNNLKSDSTGEDYAKFREAQERVLKIKNTGMAVTMDIGEPGNIHPLDKKDVGLRLAKIAFAKTYNLPVFYKGPQYNSYKVEGDTIKMSFTDTGSGLTTSDNKPPKYFYVAGVDKKFHKADARIVNGQVWLYNYDVNVPVAVRYAFTNYPVSNFCNKECLPAVPFRTDDW